MNNLLQERYRKEIIPELTEELALGNSAAAPRVVKVVVNVGLGEAAQSREVIEKVRSYLAIITGQRGVATLAKKSIAGFKIRQGQPLGVKVTLRGERMYAFLERLFKLVLPRSRDFQGLPLSGFDGSGNYTIGLSEQLVFPELNLDLVDKPRGLEVTIVTDTGDQEKAKALLKKLGAPFK
jgi:large subunit ribosomal protein L5